MKKLFLIAFLAPIFGFSQENSNFKAENNSLTWEKVYESDLTSEEIKDLLNKDATLHNLAEGFTGQSSPEKIKCSPTTPIYMRDKVQFFAKIEFKEGRYRVQVSKLEFTPSVTIELGGVRTSESQVPIEDYQLKKNGDLRTGKMHNNSRACLDKYFSDKFAFTSTEKTGRKWTQYLKRTGKI